MAELTRKPYNRIGNGLKTSSVRQSRITGKDLKPCDIKQVITMNINLLIGLLKVNSKHIFMRTYLLKLPPTKFNISVKFNSDIQ